MMTSKNITLHPDAQAFLATAGAMLYARETVNNLILGVSERLVSDPKAYDNPFFATVSDDDGGLILAAVMTPPHNLILAGEVQAEAIFSILIDHLLANHIHVPGVIGPAETTESFSKVWEQLTGSKFEVSMRQRVYELRQVQMPILPPGEFLLAGPAEIPLIAKWLQAFEVEALAEIHDLNLTRAERLVIDKNIFIWANAGQAVSMAMKTRPIAHSATVSGVYTPGEHRRRGYASAVVALLSQHLLDEGYRFVNLFTDLDNSTTNKIYQAIGYFPVCDFRMYRFL
jgi:hypothetical protein